MSRTAAWKQRAEQLRRESYALYLACRDPRLPWYARLLAMAVVGYACSPIDLIPDFIPILGYLDDLFLVPLGVALVLRMIPAEVLAECRLKAQEALAADQPTNWLVAGLIIALWLMLALLAIRLLVRAIGY